MTTTRTAAFTTHCTLSNRCPKLRPLTILFLIIVYISFIGSNNYEKNHYLHAASASTEVTIDETTVPRNHQISEYRKLSVEQGRRDSRRVTAVIP